MISSAQFNPTWVSTPSDTLLDLMDENGLSIEELCNNLGLSESKGMALLEGKVSIGEELAERLASLFNCSPAFWINRECLYRHRESALSRDEIIWLESLPTSDLVKGGWIPKRLNLKQKLTSCLNFFDVDCLDAWEEKYLYKHQEVAYRTSNSFDTEPMSALSWLRMAEVQTEKMSIEKWNPSLLNNQLDNLRKLTLVKSPQIFIPKVRETLALCGVYFTVSKTPQKCRASGATHYTQSGSPIVSMSFRYLTDDQFWFTFFHEIGHVLMHDKQRVRLEGNFEVNELEEKEANEFAENILVPEHYRKELYKLRAKDWIKLVRLAKRVGTSPGILLGQLQHKGLISYKYLNKLKTRYKWSQINSTEI
ncbi:ImmA/IrrE family metallo-endopeptidase [Neiella marina]|uniref:ImmA/IrrE family metallo-endopeptidase n=1 Tax=Neiella holothuriorum TaxID=2870530 RepID=A0ABS7EBK6_9GAMM|nr:ImmA/IrrE family metallo-endopeptidase [Neiella holothuriorum]MBW8189676.1 ImmA/IrrE family metallo-endopeptidase [Neiella holothuriorum]